MGCQCSSYNLSTVFFYLCNGNKKSKTDFNWNDHLDSYKVLRSVLYILYICSMRFSKIVVKIKIETILPPIYKIYPFDLREKQIVFLQANKSSELCLNQQFPNLSVHQCHTKGWGWGLGLIKNGDAETACPSFDKHLTSLP